MFNKKKTTSEMMAEFRQAQGWSTDEALASFPLLTSGKRTAWNGFFIDVVQVYSSVRDWLLETFPAKGDDGDFIANMMAESILFSPDVRALGDQHCRAIYPAFLDLGSSDQPVGEGEKAKLVGPFLPSVVAALDNAVVLVSRIAPRESGFRGVSGGSLSIVSRSDIQSARRIKVGGMLAKVPGFQYTITEDNETNTMTLFWNDLFPKKVIDKIASDLAV